MTATSTEELIAVWDATTSSTREIDFYITGSINWTDILLTRVFDEEFFGKFFYKSDQEIPVSLEMLSFQRARGKNHWYTFSREILLIYDSLQNSRATKNREDAIEKIKFIRLLKIGKKIPKFSDAQKNKHHTQHIKGFKELLSSALTSDTENQYPVFETIFNELMSLSKEVSLIEKKDQIQKREARIEGGNNGPSYPNTLGQQEPTKKNDIDWKKVNETRNQLIYSAENTASVVTVRNESVVKSQPITILNKNSSSITLMNNQDLLRLMKENRPMYYSKCDTSLRFFTWYSSTRCELFSKGKSTFLRNIRWHSNKLDFSGEEIAIVSRVFLLEKIKLVRRALKEALDDHHGN